jgi:hypothetical protein
MSCITAIATLKNDLRASINLSPSLSSGATLKGGFSAIVDITNETITQTTSLKNEKLIANVVLTNSGVNSAPCPIIFCIDGGSASTLSYPPINGLLNGGSA